MITKTEKFIVLEILKLMIFYVGSSCEKYLSKRWMKHKSSMNNERDKTTPLYQKMNELGVRKLLHRTC